MISGKSRSTIKHAHVRREGVMSEMGHSLPMHTSSVSSNVRYASDCVAELTYFERLRWLFEFDRFFVLS